MIFLIEQKIKTLDQIIFRNFLSIDNPNININILILKHPVLFYFILECLEIEA